MKHRTLNSSLVLTVLLTGTLITTSNAQAVPVVVDSGQFGNPCDNNFAQGAADELGLFPGFPADERISTGTENTSQSACVTPNVTDNPVLINQLVTIKNETQIDFFKVWYVSDLETGLTNVDSLINGEEAFLIDNIGVNKPLIFEDKIVDNIFQAGETWRFIIQDYSNTAGLPASALGSAGLVGRDSVPPRDGMPPNVPQRSSGSIIAFPVPPTLALLGSGIAGLGFFLRRCKAIG